jgi:dTDP-4-dehydrorhamnose reductase
MSLVVLGAEGQLGAEFCRQLQSAGIKFLGLSRRQVDLGKLHEAEQTLKSCGHVRGIINCAAYTKVDLAESESELCQDINGGAVHHLAQLCNEKNWLLVQISTDYVFGQEMTHPHPWREQDKVSPQGVYAQSKYQGEEGASRAGRHLIVRTCGLYGPLHKQGLSNFVETMLRLGREKPRLRVVNDQHCTPSYVRDIVAGILFLIENEQKWGEFLPRVERNRRIVHLVNRGETTWHDFAREIFRLSNISTPIDPITTAEFGAKSPRPTYSVLDCSRYDRFAEIANGPIRRTWQAALADYISSKNAE